MKNLEENIYWIWLSQIQSIGSIKKQRLLEKYKTPEKIFKLNKEQLMQNKEITEKVANEILDETIRKNIKNHIEYMKKNNIKIINYKDEEYPYKLKTIYDYPISIYVKGNIKILNEYSIAIIGCRNCTQYGEYVAKNFSYNLSKEGIHIVSGLARGIDSFAHIGTVCAKKNTIAVLGNGLDTIYPSENRILSEKILENGGTLITEYPLGTKPQKMNFPARNRIISGLSNSIVVIEAKKESGTLITVDFALEQGKDIFVIPGNISSKNSEGTNDLIKQGAKLVTNYKEIIE